MRQDISAVKDEGRLEHAVVDFLEVEILELVPLGEDSHGMGSITSFYGALHHNEVGIGSRAKNIGTDLLFTDLRVVDVNLGSLGKEVAADGDGCSLAGVVGVLLEGET